jgi:hypothetical protein
MLVKAALAVKVSVTGGAGDGHVVFGCTRKAGSHSTAVVASSLARLSVLGGVPVRHLTVDAVVFQLEEFVDLHYSIVVTILEEDG